MAYEIKKMKQGMSYSCKEKTIILNVFKYFRLQFTDKCVTEIVRRTAKATGCSEKSIFQFRKEEASAEGFKTPSTTKIRRNININSRDIKYDDTVRQAIRHVIYDLKYKNIVPSLNTILKQINANPSLPHFSLMTLRRLMFDMGFCYEKNGNKSVLVEKPIVKKENLPNKGAKKAKTVAPNSNNAQQPVVEVKPAGHMPLNNLPMQPNQIHEINHQQRFYMGAHHENHMVVPSMHGPHNMPPMMLNHGMPPPHPVGPPNMNMHLKHEMPPWMHHPPPHAMMKQE